MTDLIKRERHSPNLAQEYQRDRSEDGLRALQEFDVVSHLLQELARAHQESGSIEPLTERIIRAACESNQK